jgi:hypothetical protein
VVAGVIDQGSGEVRSLRVPPGNEGTVAWLQTLPTPVRVVYEAGPTGYGLARACAGAGISCVVAAPSRIRPAADRVTTGRRDAERLARLLRLGEITPVRVPHPEEEAARALVRAREDARGDLMRARHRLSKLLLRHGMRYGRMLDAKTRREALDKAITELAGAPPYVDVVERTAAPAGSTDAGTRSRPEASPARSSWSPSRAGSPDTAGHSRRWSSRYQQRLGEESAPAQRREERPERTLRAAPPATLDARERHRSSPSHTRSCGTNPRI